MYSQLEKPLFTILVISFLLFTFPAYSQPNDLALTKSIPITEEIEKIQSEIAEIRDRDELHRGELQRILFLEKYVALLDHMNESDSNPHSHALVSDETQSTKNITELRASDRKAILTILEELDEFKNLNIPPKSILDLIKYIEKNKNHWRAHSKPNPFIFRDQQDLPLKDSDGNLLQVGFDVDNKSNIYLNFKNKMLGEGTAKVVERVVHLKDWSRLKRSKFKKIDPFHITHTSSTDPEKQRHEIEFEKEMEFLTTISHVPLSERMGLVDMIGFGNNKIFQVMYDKELFDLIIENEGNSERLNLDMRLDILRQLSLGLKQLASLGICHSDIKPENVLVNEPQVGSAYTAVLSDYGMAYFPEKLIRNREVRPAKGSRHYAAPEVFKFHTQEAPGWTGATPQEAATNALKADVFSLGVVAYNLLYSIYNPPIYAPWMNCDETRGDYLLCRKTFFNDFINKLKVKKDPINHLLYSAMNPNATERISAEGFYHEILKIIEARKKPHRAAAQPVEHEDPLVHAYRQQNRKQPSPKQKEEHEPLHFKY